MKIIPLTSILTTLFLVANGQHVPYGLRETKVKKELITRTSEFDSLILTDKASYWNEDMKISGLGFKQDQVYEVTINYEPDTSSFYDMKIKEFRQERIQTSSTIQSIRKMALHSIMNLNNDSLNLKPSWGISDQNEWTILYLTKQQIVVEQSYALETYQPILPTRDRQLFLDLFVQLSEVTN